MLACVHTARHAEPEIKIETLDDLVLEVVPFDHSEVVHRLVSNGKFHTKMRKGSMKYSDYISDTSHTRKHISSELT